MKNILLPFFFLFVSTLLFAQPANNNCSGAQNLGTLGAPGACGSGIVNGAVSTVAGTLVGATPENPYVTLGGCGMASPANSVWYRFTDPVNGYGAVISISGATFANPNIALYNGSNCNNLTGVDCIVGTGGTATLNVGAGLIPGQTYYIFISGNTGQTGTFTLSVNAYQNCSTCNNSATLTVSPLPVNGTYQPGQTVSFCYHITQWTQEANNWLHGVQLSFGAGWNLASLVASPPPPYLSNSTYWGGSIPTCGNWAYYPAGTVSTATGLTWPAGFYYDGTYSTNAGGNVNGCALVDGNPGNNFGDGVGCVNCIFNPGSGDWNFCWTIQVASGCNPGMSLLTTVNTSGDGESGLWSSAGCSGDPAAMFDAIVACCPPNVSSTATCSNLSTGTATATPVGSASPYVYLWTAGGQTTQTATGLAPGTYTVSVTDVNLCKSTATVVVTGNPVPTATAITNITQCVGSTVSVPAFVSSPVGANFA